MTRQSTLEPSSSTALSCGKLSKTPPTRNQLVNNSYEKASCKTENIYGVYREGLRGGNGREQEHWGFGGEEILVISRSWI